MKKSMMMFAMAVVLEAAADVSNLVQRVHLDAYADVETAYKARGVVIDRHPIIVQSVEPMFDLAPFGMVGFDVWSVSSLSHSGQSFNRRYAYNEVYYDVFYCYDWEFADDWKLSSAVWYGWDTVPGFRDGSKGFSEWNFTQELVNPYVTPYYQLECVVQGDGHCLWTAGLKRTFELAKQLKLTVNFFTELADNRHLQGLYGPNPYSGDGRYRDCFLALDLDVRLAYYITEWMNVYMFVHQFDTVSSQMRHTEHLAHRLGYAEALPDITYGGVGLQIQF